MDLVGSSCERWFIESCCVRGRSCAQAHVPPEISAIPKKNESEMGLFKRYIQEYSTFFHEQQSHLIPFSFRVGNAVAAL